jgi:hypothetical protein
MEERRGSGSLESAGSDLHDGDPASGGNDVSAK